MRKAEFPYSFEDYALLRTALTVPAPNRKEPDNQRLEYLGDAVLQLLISDALYQRYPEANEGALTDMRLHLVSSRGLLERVPKLGAAFQEGLATFNRNKTWQPKAEVDAVEALLGAAWLDGGLPAAKCFFQLLFSEEDFQSVAHCTGISDNPKGELQQYTQRHHQGEPVYTLLEQSGPAHAPSFRCSVTVLGQTTEGYGASRKAAEAMAAKTLLEALLANESQV